MFNFNLTAMNPSFRIMNEDQKRAQTWSRIKKEPRFPTKLLNGVH